MIEELKTFIAVVEERSFTKAAEKVNLTQPSVSAHIKNLEAYFGTTLVTRSIKLKKILITESGNLLYKRSKELLSLFETTTDELRHLSTTFRGHIKVGASSAIGECLLPAFLAEFCKAYNEIDVDVFIGNTTETTALMRALQIDLALVEGVLSFPSFKQRCFFEDQLLLIAPKSYCFDEDFLASPLLQEERWLTREHGSGLREALDTFLVLHQIVPKRKLLLSSNHALKEAVKNGLGLTIIPKCMMKYPDDFNDLQIFPLGPNLKIALSSLLPKDLPPSPITLLFLENFVDYIKKHQAQ